MPEASHESGRPSFDNSKAALLTEYESARFQLDSIAQETEGGPGRSGGSSPLLREGARGFSFRRNFLVVRTAAPVKLKPDRNRHSCDTHHSLWTCFDHILSVSGRGFMVIMRKVACFQRHGLVFDTSRFSQHSRVADQNSITVSRSLARVDSARSFTA